MVLTTSPSTPPSYLTGVSKHHLNWGCLVWWEGLGALFLGAASFLGCGGALLGGLIVVVMVVCVPS
jgi:hypothetical protein